MSDLSTLAQQLGDQLIRRHIMLAVAESCTGGWLAKCLTDVTGSSRWFDRGFVTYSNAAKQSMLGVAAETLENHGAVSEATVLEMVAGALKYSEAGLAVAISGLAGPGGAVAGKPVGTVCFAWQLEGAGGHAQTLHFEGDRESVRRQSVAHALNVMLDELGTG